MFKTLGANFGAFRLFPLVWFQPYFRRLEIWSFDLVATGNAKSSFLKSLTPFAFKVTSSCPGHVKASKSYDTMLIRPLSVEYRGTPIPVQSFASILPANLHDIHIQHQHNKPTCLERAIAVDIL